MREIKFRVWDSGRNKMCYLLENRFSFGTCESDRAVSWEEVFAERHKELIPLEYTGLKDERGTEVYEGDILQGIDFRMNVFWRKDGGSWSVTDLWTDSFEPLADYTTWGFVIVLWYK